MIVVSDYQRTHFLGPHRGYETWHFIHKTYLPGLHLLCTTSVLVLWMFKGIMIWDHRRVKKAGFGGHLGIILCDYPGVILGQFLNMFGTFVGSSKDHFGFAATLLNFPKRNKNKKQSLGII